MSKISFLKKLDKNMTLAGIAVIGVVVVGVLIYANSTGGVSLSKFNFGWGRMSSDEVAKKAIDYINANLTQTPVTLVSSEVDSETGLVKFKLKMGSNEFDSYATKDGKVLFPQAFKMDEKEGDSASADAKPSQSAEEIIASIQKSDKPMIEAFIVSRCPFGLQMQRMIADAVKNLPQLSENIAVKYIGSVSSDGKSITAMHGEAEANENLRQICIREEQPAKYWPYVECQMKSAGQETACEKSTGVDSSKLSACISDAKRGVAYAQKDFDASNKYNATGSPTLILNGKEIVEFTSDNKPVFGSSRSSDELKEIVCAASNTKPDFCSKKINTKSAAASFSATYEGAGSSSDASCN